MKPAILVVDDDEVMRQTLSDVLKKRGYAVSAAETGGETLSCVQDQLFDLILLDIRLPDMSGFEICRQLHSSFQTSHIPIICLTEKREQVDKIEGLEA